VIAIDHKAPQSGWLGVAGRDPLGRWMVDMPLEDLSRLEQICQSERISASVKHGRIDHLPGNADIEHHSEELTPHILLPVASPTMGGVIMVTNELRRYSITCPKTWQHDRALLGSPWIEDQKGLLDGSLRIGCEVMTMIRASTVGRHKLEV
jgi:hypothetical protein